MRFIPYPVVGGFLAGTGRRLDHFSVMPGVLGVFIAVFFLALLATGISVDDAMARGLLLGEISGLAVWQPLALGKHFLTADWVAILGQGGNIAITIRLVEAMSR